MMTPTPIYGNKDLIRLALERVVSFHVPKEGKPRYMLNISTQTTSKDYEVVNVVEKMYQEFWAFHSNFKIEGMKLENLFPEQDDIIKWDLVAATNAAREVFSMKIFTPEDGRLGFGTRSLRDTDNIAILRSCNLLTILRAHGKGYKLIGM